jgi:Mn-containing catalase
MPKDGMLHKEKQMVALGARLAEPNTQIEKSATEASLEETAEISILSHAAQNISEAYVQAFKWASLFLGATGEIVFDLNTDYLAASLGAQEREQLIKEWQIGGITFEEYRWNLTRAGVANIPFDTVKNELDGKPQEPETKPVNTQTI